jgi:3-hydroxyisobutyrate dehydrogenase-like beta-hydroxyacid dehydrogenase
MPLTPSHLAILILGIMGEGMSARLLSKNVAGSVEHPLFVWNRTPSKCVELKDRFDDKNVIICESAREVVERSDVVL